MNIEGMNQNEMHKLRFGNVTLLLQVDEQAKIDGYEPDTSDSMRLTQYDVQYDPFADDDEASKITGTTTHGRLADCTLLRVVFTDTFTPKAEIARDLRRIADLVEHSEAPFGLDGFKPGDSEEV